MTKGRVTLSKTGILTVKMRTRFRCRVVTIVFYRMAISRTTMNLLSKMSNLEGRNSEVGFSVFYSLKGLVFAEQFPNGCGSDLDKIHGTKSMEKVDKMTKFHLR